MDRLREKVEKFLLLFLALGIPIFALLMAMTQGMK